MNFYMGNTIGEINKEDFNAEVRDDLIDFIYKLKGQVAFDMSKLYEINPYDDVEIPKSDLPQIVKICKYMLETSLLKDYKEKAEGDQMLRNLLKVAQEAIARNIGLVSIGD